MFKGHNFIKLVSDTWVLDMTEFICYKVDLYDNGDIKNYTKAFRVVYNNGKITTQKFIPIPIKIIREAMSVVSDYLMTMEIQ